MCPVPNCDSASFQLKVIKNVKFTYFGYNFVAVWHRDMGLHEKCPQRMALRSYAIKFWTWSWPKNDSCTCTTANAVHFSIRHSATKSKHVQFTVMMIAVVSLSRMSSVFCFFSWCHRKFFGSLCFSSLLQLVSVWTEMCHFLEFHPPPRLSGWNRRLDDVTFKRIWGTPIKLTTGIFFALFLTGEAIITKQYKVDI